MAAAAEYFGSSDFVLGSGGASGLRSDDKSGWTVSCRCASVFGLAGAVLPLFLSFWKRVRSCCAGAMLFVEGMVLAVVWLARACSLALRLFQ